jgi:hypothetical protein
VAKDGKNKMTFKKRIRQEHHHIVLPRYLSDYIIELAEKHKTSVSHEIASCILFKMFNDREGV